jgi:hypothetical protein
MVFGLFMFGFDDDNTSVFDETVKFNIAAKYDACADSGLTPYPGTLTWYEMKKANRIVSFDWTMYDQGHVVYRPAGMSADELRIGEANAFEGFYSKSSIGRRFPLRGKRHSRAVARLQSLHAQGIANREHRFDCGTYRGAGACADAADPAGEARMACGCAGGGKRYGKPLSPGAALAITLIETRRPSTKPPSPSPGNGT